MNDNKSIRIAFNSHGMGDVVHCCHAMQLYQSRGYDVAIQVEPNKRWVWGAAGIPIHHGAPLPIHPYYYPADFFDLSKPDHTHSKIAHLFEVAELPKLGTKPEVWQAICETKIDATPAVSCRAMDDAGKFLEGLPHPIILLHSKGTNWQEEKSIPDGVAFQVIRNLLETGGSVVTLDWDGRAPTLGHDRVRGIKPNWHHISLEEFGALCILSDLLIGVDSGPFHLAGWFDIPTLYVSRKIPPVRCCLPSSNATYLVAAKDHEHWAGRGPEWKFAEYQGQEATVQDIVITAISILEPEAVEVVTMREIQSNQIPGVYTYRRVGHDERRMELLADGRIGEGAAGCERIWKIERTPSGAVVTIFGEHGGPTCHLTLGKDGILRGCWLAHERMPIELQPMVATEAWEDFNAVVEDVPCEIVKPNQTDIINLTGHPSDLEPDGCPSFYFGILTYNRFDLLELALEAVLRSSVLPTKIFVVDNSGGKWQGHLSRRIEIIRTPYNLGVARGFNVLQNLTQPSPLIIGADDIEVGADLFERMLSHPTPIVFADESRAYSVHMIRSEAWDKIGPWDGKFYPAYHEDNDYAMRARVAGVETGCPVSSGFIDHGPSATKAAMSEAERSALNGWFGQGRERYVAKWGGPPHLETFTVPFNGVPQ